VPARNANRRISGAPEPDAGSRVEGRLAAPGGGAHRIKPRTSDNGPYLNRDAVPIHGAQFRDRSVNVKFPAVLPDLGIVVLGGAAGSLARYLVTLAVGDTGAFPLATFGINVVGAFLLGVLVEALTRLGSDHGRWRSVRLLLGTGVLGGFTTYSLLAADTAELLLDGRAWVALGYGVGTLAVGGAASWLGVLTGRALVPGAARGGAR
jgi:CrcB protein